MQNVEGFQVIRQPHLKWFEELLGNEQPGNPFGHAGPSSIRVVGAIRNAGIERNQPSFGSYDDKDVMTQIKKQIKKQTKSMRLKAYLKIWRYYLLS